MACHIKHTLPKTPRQAYYDVKSNNIYWKFVFSIIALNYNKIKNTEYKHHILVACAWGEYFFNTVFNIDLT